MKFYKLETTSVMDNVEDNVIEMIPYPKNGDRTFMLEKIGQNYKCYLQASPDLKRDQVLVNEAIHNCIQYETNNSPSVDIAHAKIIGFTNKVRMASGLLIQTLIRKTNDEETIVYSVDRPKSKVLKFEKRKEEFRELSESDNYWENNKAA